MQYQPHTEDVKQKIIRFLHKQRNPVRTTYIADNLHDKRKNVYKRENVYRALQRLKTRGLVFKYKERRGNNCRWLLNFDRIQNKKVPKKILIRNKIELETNLRKVITPIEQTIKHPIVNLAVKTALTSVPIAREVYLGSLVAKNMYSLWDNLYESTKNLELEDTENSKNDCVKEIGETILTKSQTDIVWNKLKTKIRPEYQNSVHIILQTTINKITEGEISIVEQALQSL